jgi:hypothetical protein
MERWAQRIPSRCRVLSFSCVGTDTRDQRSTVPRCVRRIEAIREHYVPFTSPEWISAVTAATRASEYLYCAVRRPIPHAVYLKFHHAPDVANVGPAWPLGAPDGSVPHLHDTAFEDRLIR